MSTSKYNVPNYPPGTQAPKTERLYKICFPDGRVRELNEDQYVKILTFGKNELVDVSVIDKHRSRKVDYNTNGVPYYETPVGLDYYEGIDINEVIEPQGDEELVDEEIKINSKKIKLTSCDLINMINNPILYHNKIQSKSSNIGYLLSCIIQQPSQFDELFVLEVKSPESPLLKSYLDNLAEMVSEELDKSEQIDDIEKLENDAYKKVGYVGKTFEAVLNDARDFQDYFRFLLTKGEKVVVNQYDYNYVNKLSKIIKENNNYKFNISESKQKKNEEIILDSDNYSRYFYFSEIAHLYIKNKEYLLLFIHVDDISSSSKFIEENNLDIKIALCDKIFCENYLKLKECCISLFICDKNYNHKKFDLKSTTLNKWKKKLQGYIDLVDTLGLKSKISYPNNLKSVSEI